MSAEECPPQPVAAAQRAQDLEAAAAWIVASLNEATSKAADAELRASGLHAELADARAQLLASRQRVEQLVAETQAWRDHQVALHREQLAQRDAKIVKLQALVRKYALQRTQHQTQSERLASDNSSVLCASEAPYLDRYETPFVPPTVDHLSTFPSWLTRSTARKLVKETLLLPWGCELVYEASRHVQIMKMEEALARPLVYFYHRAENIVPIICGAITREVRLSRDLSTLFRSNSLASKLLKAYTTLIAKPFLKTVLEPFLADIVKKNILIEVNETVPQIDPGRVPAAKAASNRKKLIKACFKMLDGLTDAMGDAPLEFRQFARHIFDAVATKYGGEFGGLGVGAFVFLRTLCPALTSPEVYGILEDAPGSQARRSLILISKCLQVAANGSTHTKEACMEPMMELIDTMREPMMTCLKSFAEVPAKEPTRLTIAPAEVEAQFERLLTTLAESRTEIVDHFTTNPLPLTLCKLDVPTVAITISLGECLAPMHSGAQGMEETDPNVARFVDSLLDENASFLRCLSSCLRQRELADRFMTPLASSLAIILVARDKYGDVFRAMLADALTDVPSTEEQKYFSSLFVCHVWKAFAFCTCKEYMKQVLGPTVRDVASRTVSLDPNQANREKLRAVIAIACHIMGHILSCLVVLPSSIREICSAYVGLAMTRSARMWPVAWWLFDAVFCSALDQPVRWGLLTQDEATETSLQNLHHLSGLIRKCSTGVCSSFLHPDVVDMVNTNHKRLVSYTRSWSVHQGDSRIPWPRDATCSGWFAEAEAINAVRQNIYQLKEPLVAACVSSVEKNVAYNLCQVLDVATGPNN